LASEVGGKPLLDLENFSKKRCFLSFEWEKTNFTTFGHPWKNFGKIPVCLPGKNPSDAHDCTCKTKPQFPHTIVPTPHERKQLHEYEHNSHERE